MANTAPISTYTLKIRMYYIVHYSNSLSDRTNATFFQSRRDARRNLSDSPFDKWIINSGNDANDRYFADILRHYYSLCARGRVETTVGCFCKADDAFKVLPTHGGRNHTYDLLTERSGRSDGRLMPCILLDR